MPENTTILGAFKFTGKTKTGLSVGVLESIAAEEKARIDDHGHRRTVSVEPLTNYIVTRLQKDYDGGNMILGGILTATNRKISGTGMNFLHQAAYSGAVDFEKYFKNKSYHFALKTMFSRVSGSQESILRTQESPIRYFQRPDADHLSVDSTKTSLAGHGGTVGFGKTGGGHIRFLANVSWRSPGLELNDIGYLRSADVIQALFRFGYVVWEPFGIFRSLSADVFHRRNWNFGGEGLNIISNGKINLDFKNKWTLRFGFGRKNFELSTNELRGGPSIMRPGDWMYSYNLETDNSKKLKFTSSIALSDGDSNHSSHVVYGLGCRYRPHNALETSVEPSLEFYKNQLLYVNTTDFIGEKRYICGTIDQKTLSITFRLNYYLTPDLSIQFYGQPFVSSGDYSDYKRISDPRFSRYEDRFHPYSNSQIAYDDGTATYSIDENEDSITDYSFQNPDFNFLQFNSNLVFRWEYSPGSTLYVVWSQNRTGWTPYTEFSWTEGMQDLFAIGPHDVFLIKVNHWFSY